jgi:hypothetical protein
MQKTHFHATRIAALIIACVSLLSVLQPASAQTTAQVRFSPAEAQVPLNGTAQVAVEVVDVQALYGVDISFNFDPAVIEVVGATPDAKPEVALGTFMDAGFVVMNKVDNAAGTVRFVMTQLNPSKPKDGTGVILVLNVRGKKEGATSSFKFTKVDMARRDGTVFSGTLLPGQAKVVPASQALPAASPIPTQGAGTAMPAATAATTAATQAAPATAAPVATQAPAPIATQPQDGSTNTTTQTLMVLGGCGLGVILLIVVIAVAFILLRRNKPRK